jgi:DNA polymerase-3 subunit epsilon
MILQDNFITEARSKASDWARNLLSIPANHWIILDTETTGLDESAEVIQIGVTDSAGRILMDNLLCKPLRPIPAEATAIHHITNEMVRNAAPFQATWDTLTRIADGRIVVVYNAAYDRRLLHQSASHLTMPEPLLPMRWECAMLKHAEWVGEWNDYHGSFRWQKLQGGDHSALGDCTATLETIKKMAESRK